MTEKKAAKKKTPAKKEKPAVAMQGKIDKETHIVGIGNIRVVILPDGDLWFAQGLEIDYAAQGKTIKDVQKTFQDGLACTIYEHLKIYGTIKGVLKVAPPEVWEEMLDSAKDGQQFKFSQVSFHEVAPMYNGIVFLVPEKIAA